MSVKNVPISHSEYVSGKYSYTSIAAGGEKTAKIFYKSDGSIDESSTYSDSYQKKMKIGRYAK